MKPFCSLISLLFTILLKLLISLILLIFTPLLLLINSPVYLFRYLLSKSAKYLRPDLGKMVSSRGTVFVTDNIYLSPKCNVVLGFEIEGTLDLGIASNLIHANVIKSVFPNGKLRFPELTQYITSWMGFFFFKQDPHFNLHDHIKPHNSVGSSPVSQQEIAQLRENLVQKGWTRRKPLWEIILVYNCYNKDPQRSPYTTALVRFHHSVGDGYSFLNLVQEGLCGQDQGTSLKIPLPNFPKLGFLKRLNFLLTLPFKCAYEVSEVLLPSIQLRRNSPWRPKRAIRNCNPKFNGQRTLVDIVDTIPIKNIKEIKSHFGVSFTSVLFTVLASSLREIMLEKGMKIPQTLPLIIPLPVLGHSVKLRNEMTGAIAHLPMGEMNPVTRLRLSFKEYNRIKHSTVPILIKYLSQILGLHFAPIVRLIAPNVYATTGLSNFPGGLEPNYVDGREVFGATFSAGIHLGILGLGFCILSYVDELRISPMVHNSLLTKEELKRLSQSILEHFAILFDLVVKNQV